MDVGELNAVSDVNRGDLLALIEVSAGYAEIFPDERFSYTEREIVLPSRDLLPQMYYWAPQRIEPVRAYKIRHLSFNSSAHIFVNNEPLDGGNLFTRTAIRDTAKWLTNSKQTKELVELPKAFVFLHANFTTYGHFLLEMLPKLLVYQMLITHETSLPILLPKSTPQFIMRWIQALCPAANIYQQATSHEITTVSNAYVSDMFITHYVAGAGFKKVISAIEQSIGRVTDTSAGERIYLSRKSRRSDHSDFRSMQNSEEIEGMLTLRGFSVVEPELLPISEQVSMFRNARVVIGELSSGLHNTIFGQSGGSVIQLNPFNFVQRQIGLWKQQTVLSIVPEDGRIRSWPGDPHIEKGFRINPNDVQKALSLISDEVLA